MTFKKVGIRRAFGAILPGLLFLLMISGPAVADQWSRTFGGEKYDAAYAAQQTTDGGYIVMAATTSYSGAEGTAGLLVSKLDVGGNVEWQRIVGGPGEKISAAIVETVDGYVAAGGTRSGGAGGMDGWILKLDKSDGRILRQKTYGGSGDDQFWSIQKTSDGGFIVAGSTESFGNGKKDAWILKLTEDKVHNDWPISWQGTYGGAEDDWIASIQEISTGGFIAGGSTSSFGAGGADAWVLKLNETGGIVWQKTYGGLYADGVQTILETGDGNFIFAGSTYSFTGSTSRAWVVELGRDGIPVWQRIYGGSSNDFANAIDRTLDGGYVLAGQTYSYGVSSGQGWIVRLNEYGNISWQKTYGGDKLDTLWSIRTTSDGGFIAAGSTGSFGVGDQDAWVMKLDSNGSISNCSSVGGAYATISATAIAGSASTVDAVSTTVSPMDSMADGEIITVSPVEVCPTVAGPDISVDPNELDFGSLTIGTSASLIVTVTNTGSGDLTIGTLGVAGTDNAFAVQEDHCSNAKLGPQALCTVKIVFSPQFTGGKAGLLSIPSDDSDRENVIVPLAGEGAPSIVLEAPGNHASFSSCSLYALPEFDWTTEELFKKYEIHFSANSGFNPIGLIYRTGVPHVEAKLSPWKTVMRIVGSGGGAIYWRVVGIRADKTVRASDTWTFNIEAAKIAADIPKIAKTTTDELPELSWQNPCNKQFVVVFGKDDSFKPSVSVTYKVKNPGGPTQDFQAVLKPSQWAAVRNLVGNVDHASIYWRVDSQDVANRTARTSVMEFKLNGEAP